MLFCGRQLPSSDLSSDLPYLTTLQNRAICIQLGTFALQRSLDRPPPLLPEETQGTDQVPGKVRPQVLVPNSSKKFLPAD